MGTQYRRKPNRLPGYDYSTPGCYFVTVCTRDHQCLLGRVVSGSDNIPAAMDLTPLGQIVQDAIDEIPTHYPSAEVDKSIVMPNHFHLILVLKDGAPKMPSVHTIIQQLKRAVSVRVGTSIWQARFHDRVIRSEREYQEYWKYIDSNAEKWAMDKYYHEMW